MIRFLFAFLMVMGLASAASAQTATPTSKFQWRTNDSTSSVATYQWQLELDGVVGVLTAVTCDGGVPVVCVSPIPAITPTTHTARIRAVDMTVPGEPIEGPFTDVVTFTMRAVPSKPIAFVVIPGG